MHAARPPAGRRARGHRGRRRHRGAPGGPGPARLRRQRQPRAEDPGRRAAPARRDAARTRADDPEAEVAARVRRAHPARVGRLGRLVKELLELSRLQGADPLPRRARWPCDRIVAEVLDRTRTARPRPSIERRLTGGQRADGLRQREPAGHRAGATWSRTRSRYSRRTGPGSPSTCAASTATSSRSAVADQGIGIAAEDLDRIFERFYRADQARSRATGGTGLGLAIVKHIAVNHGGAGRRRARSGVGSTFTLRLPARPPDAACRPPGGAGLDELPPTEYRQRIRDEEEPVARVLVVEDEESFSDALSYMLRKEGFEVVGRRRPARRR